MSTRLMFKVFAALVISANAGNLANAQTKEFGKNCTDAIRKTYHRLSSVEKTYQMALANSETDIAKLTPLLKALPKEIESWTTIHSGTYQNYVDQSSFRLASTSSESDVIARSVEVLNAAKNQLSSLATDKAFQTLGDRGPYFREKERIFVLKKALENINLLKAQCVSRCLELGQVSNPESSDKPYQSGSEHKGKTE